MTASSPPYRGFEIRTHEEYRPVFDHWYVVCLHPLEANMQAKPRDETVGEIFSSLLGEPQSIGPCWRGGESVGALVTSDQAIVPDLQQQARDLIDSFHLYLRS